MLEDMSSERLAWLAGFVDGEGSIAITVNLSNSISKSPRIALNTSCYFAISQSEPRHLILHELAEETGLGLVKCKGIARLSPNYKEAWYWYIIGPKVVHIIKAIMPYLRCKRRQAELMIEMHETKFASHIGARKGGKSTDLRVSDEIALRRIQIVREICELNRRGSDKKKNIKALALAEEHYRARLSGGCNGPNREPEAVSWHEEAAIRANTADSACPGSGGLWIGSRQSSEGIRQT